MSKFFFKGRVDAREKYQRFGYSPKRAVKAGSEEAPLSLIVSKEARKDELALILKEHGLFADFTIDSDASEDIHELDVVLNKPKTTTFAKTPNRNELCSCGSQKKYKKCCGA